MGHPISFCYTSVVVRDMAFKVIRLEMGLDKKKFRTDY
jgi:hypothetical protein